MCKNLIEKFYDWTSKHKNLLIEKEKEIIKGLNRFKRKTHIQNEKKLVQISYSMSKQ